MKEVPRYESQEAVPDDAITQLDTNGAVSRSTPPITQACRDGNAAGVVDKGVHEAQRLSTAIFNLDNADGDPKGVVGRASKSVTTPVLPTGASAIVDIPYLDESIDLVETPQVFGIARVEGEQHEEHNHGASWKFLNEYLGAHERYAPETRLSTYVQERLDFISGGREAEVVVVHDDEPNAFAIAGYIVASDGLLSLAEYQEEVDGIIGGHEYRHILGGHVHEHDTYDRSVIEGIGRVRKHEMEADIEPLERLDAKGINVAGFMSMFAKLDNWQKEHAKEAPGSSMDVTHGTLLDRRLNLEEVLKFLDLTHLTPNLTPIGVSEADFGQYERDEELRTHFNDLDPLRKRHFVARQIARYAEETENMTEEQRSAHARHIVAWQKDTLLSADPTFTEEELETLTRLAVVFAADDAKAAGKVVEDADDNPSSWRQVFTDSDSVRAFVSAFDHEVFETLAMNPKKDRLYIQDQIQGLLAVYLRSQEEISISEYVELVSACEPILPDPQTGGSHWVTGIEAYTRPIISELYRRNELTSANINELGDALVEKPVYTSDYIPVDNRTKNAQLEQEGLDKIDASQRIEQRILMGRMEKLRHITDPGAILTYVSTHLPSVLIQGGVNFQISGLPAGLASEHIETVFTGLTTEQILQIAAQDAQVAPEAQMSQQIKESFVDVMTGGYLEDSTAGRFKKQRDFPLDHTLISDPLERVQIYAALLSKEEFFARIEDDIRELIGGMDRKGPSIKDQVRLFKAIQQAPEQLRSQGIPVAWEINRDDLLKTGHLLDTVYQLMTKDVIKPHREKTVADMLYELPVTVLPSELWDDLAKHVLSNTELAGTARMEAIMGLGLLSPNTEVNLIVPNQAALAAVEGMSFDEGMAFIFERNAHLPRYIFGSALEHLIEQKARTHHDFEQLERAIKSDVEVMLENDTTIGEAAVVDALIDPFKLGKERVIRVAGRTHRQSGMKPEELLGAMLQTGTSDRRLKEYLYGQWWNANRIGQTQRAIAEEFDVEGEFNILRYPGKEAAFINWAKRVPEDYIPFTAVVNDAFLTRKAMRYAAMRKILTGDGGVLTNSEAKGRLVETFISNSLEAEDGSEGTMIRTMLDSLMAVGDQDELYKVLSPIFVDMILKLPEERYLYGDLAREKAREMIEDIRASGRYKTAYEKDEDVLRRKIWGLMTANQQKVDEASRLSDSARELLALFPEDATDTTAKMSAWELGAIVGDKLGTLGTRVKQVSTQTFATIPHEHREAYANSFDNSVGQTRLQAYRVLRREAERSRQAPESPEMAKFFDSIASFGPRIGGGSLMTVYELTMKDGSREAVAIRNPNVEYHLGKSVHLFRRTIEQAQLVDPDNKNYALIGAVLEDVEEWVHNELYDARYIEDDREFRERYDVRYGNYDTSTRYTILVPDARDTGTTLVRRDAFIEGVTLNRLEVLEEGETDVSRGVIRKDDYQAAIASLTRFSLQQLADGLIHSNIHPGNYMLTADNNSLAVLDRPYKLRLDEQQQGLIYGVMEAFISSDLDSARKKFVDYLLAQEENHHRAADKEAIVEALSAHAQSDTFEGTLMDSIVGLKQQGLRIPLPLALIGLNLQTLNGMNRDAGLNSIMGGIMHR